MGTLITLKSGTYYEVISTTRCDLREKSNLATLKSAARFLVHAVETAVYPTLV